MTPTSTRTPARRLLAVLATTGALAFGALACSSTPSTTTNAGNSSTTAATSGSSSTTNPAGGGGASEASVNFSSSGCDPKTVELKAGAITLKVMNKGDETGEFEILQDGKIKGEAENIAPNFPASIKATLDPGTYELLCGEDSFPKGKLVVT